MIMPDQATPIGKAEPLANTDTVSYNGILYQPLVHTSLLKS